MKNFTTLEMRILKNLRDSLEESFAQAIEKFTINSPQFLAASQRLIISEEKRKAAPFGEFASATVEVTNFIEKRRSETALGLVAAYKSFTENDEINLWITVSMLAAEGLVELNGQLGVVRITKEGLEAIREGQVRG